MSRKLVLALLLLCISLPVVGQNLGEQSSAGYTNARTYANVDLPGLRPPLRLFETVPLAGTTNANSLAVFEKQFLVGQPGASGSPITYSMFNRDGATLWTQTLAGSTGTFHFVPAFSNSLVILGGEGTTSVKAVNVVNGSVVWSDSAGDTNGRFPAVTDNYAIYAGSNKIEVRTLAGEVFYQQAVTTAAAALAVRDDSLYFATKSGVLTAINLVTKSQKWTVSLVSENMSFIPTEKYVFVCDPGSQGIGALEAASGADWVWTKTDLQGTFATPALALSSGRLFLFRSDDGTGNADVTAYDANTGAQLWRVTEDGSGLNHAFIVGDTLYYYRSGDQIRARDAATGALLWSIQRMGVRAMTAANGELYVLDNNSIDVYQPSYELFMPHMAHGMGQTTVVMLVNTTPQEVHATVYFYDVDGDAVPVPLRTYGTKSEVEVTVAANSSLAVETQDPGTELNSGWVRVVSDAPLRGTVNFQYSQQEEIVREAGVADSLPIGSGNVFVSIAGDFDAGVAIANPTEQDTNVTLRLLTTSGVELATKTYPLASGAQMAKFVSHIFTEEVGTAFDGTLVIEAEVPVVITAIRTKGGIQISSYPVGQAVR